jgi:hypothetical protein
MKPDSRQPSALPEMEQAEADDVLAVASLRQS